ncbi:MAG TPA: hypothetical protein VMJ65_20155 [Solirubrobacteraceae bacterium]|nr:hypothetical protein [Solirubrobacteraceae bacterium]
MRLLVRISARSGGGDSLIVLGLLTTAMLLSPPRGGALSVCIVIALVVTLTSAVLHAIRSVGVERGRGTRLGSWARATTALGVSASILMILCATVAACG